MNDQKNLWNSVHTKENSRAIAENQTQFAEEVLRIIPSSSQILELGCGVGNDSVLFAKSGHTVLATDFSEVIIEKNIALFKDLPHIQFKVVDMTEPMDISDNTVDVVYARLSLHYFTDEVTRNIINEIKRVLKSDGLLCFICKSTTDPLYGKGEALEKNMFNDKGKTRHFFSEEYVKSLLVGNFSIEKMESGNEKFYGSDSAYVKVIAKATK